MKESLNFGASRWAKIVGKLGHNIRPKQVHDVRFLPLVFRTPENKENKQELEQG